MGHQAGVIKRETESNNRFYVSCIRPQQFERLLELGIDNFTFHCRRIVFAPQIVTCRKTQKPGRVDSVGKVRSIGTSRGNIKVITAPLFSFCMQTHITAQGGKDSDVLPPSSGSMPADASPLVLERSAKPGSVAATLIRGRRAATSLSLRAESPQLPVCGGSVIGNTTQL